MFLGDKVGRMRLLAKRREDEVPGRLLNENFDSKTMRGNESGKKKKKEASSGEIGQEGRAQWVRP